MADSVEGADLVVKGSIEDRDEGPPKIIQSSGDPVTYTVAVADVFKGESGPVTKVESAAESASCGLQVEAITGPATAPDDSILPPTGGPPLAAMALGGLLLAGVAVVAAVVLRRRRHS